ncbi:MAG: ABC transporter ATP-binding protein/permease [Oscillospiraceae bacterium]|nr:ABC transporter ATP-binding protein/permease [Oscillospiraceae bacterium]
MIKTLAAQIRQYKRSTLLTPLFTILEVVMEVLIPFVTATIIDKGINGNNGEGDLPTVFIYGGVMIVMAFLSLTFGVLAGKFAANASAGFACNLRDAMFSNIQTFSFSNIDKYSTAGLVTRMTTDVTNLQNAFQMIIRIAVRAPIMLISSVVMCVIINPGISLIFLGALVVLGTVLVLIVSKATKVFDKVFTKYDDLNASVQENISGIRVVKGFVREGHENEKFVGASGNLYKMFVSAEKIISWNQPVMMFVIYACILLISWFGAQFIVGGTMTTGELTSMFSYIMNALMSLMMLSMIFVMLTMSVASARRICEVLNEKTDITNPADPIMEIPDGSIDFDHVNFAYKHSSELLREKTDADGGEEILTDIDLHIHAGETIGIIGGTGCGKSTFASLISRLYDVDSGEVRVGGTDVRKYDLELLRDKVAVVLQKNVLFSGTILDNLRWGNENATEEECMEACRLACADEFIEKMPDGYNTRIEQGGSNVSGGQKQRLCIARALLKSPKILILDDSTSAVDTATDAKIRQAFAQKIPGTTKLIIAQRISSVQDADRIIVMDDGRICGFDTHENLLKNNKIYSEIYTIQTQSGGDFDKTNE